METVVKTVDEVNEKVARETLFAYLDKGIDDMEAGRMHTVDEAFEIIRERMFLHQDFIFIPNGKKGIVLSLN